MKRAALCLVTLALAATPAACGDDDDDNGGGGPSTTATSPPPDDLAKQVQGSGSFRRMALVVGDQTVEPKLIEDCLSPDLAASGRTRLASYRAAAPPCRPVARVGVLPKLRIKPGDTLEIHTGTQTAGAFITFIEFGDPASRRKSVNAEQDGDTLQRWRATAPGDLKVIDRVDVNVGPLRTDSGSVTFAARAQP